MAKPQPQLPTALFPEADLNHIHSNWASMSRVSVGLDLEVFNGFATFKLTTEDPNDFTGTVEGNFSSPGLPIGGHVWGLNQ